MNVREPAPGVLHFEEDYRVYCTLVRGQDAAILWDTGQGRLDLKDWMDARVTTPYRVMNSHGHADHIGGNRRFDRVYAPRPDWPLLEAYSNLTDRRPPAYDILPLEAGQVYETSSYVRNYELIGIVKDYDAGTGILTLEQRNRFFKGDELEILQPTVPGFTVLNVDYMTDENGWEISSAPNPKMIVKIKSDKKIIPNSIIRKVREG